VFNDFLYLDEITSTQVKPLVEIIQCRAVNLSITLAEVVA